MNKNKSSNRLLIAILIGIVFGIALGGAWPEAGIAVKFIGEIFIKALLMLVIPLVMTSMVVGITRFGDVRKLGGIGKQNHYLLLNYHRPISDNGQCTGKSHPTGSCRNRTETYCPPG